MGSSVDPASAEQRRDRASPRSAARSPVLRFAALSILAMLVLAMGTVLVAERIARHQALDEARARGAGVADRVAAPLVDATVRAGTDGAATREQLNLVMSNRMADGSLSHVKLWDEQGRIIWSDDKDLVGRRFDLEADVAALFGTREVTAEVSDLSKEENVEEYAEGELLEVYAGTFDADGVPLVFEAYFPVDQMEQDTRTLVVAFVPLVVGALMLFLAVVLPLAVSLSRRVEQAQLERSRATRHALLASDLERRRIAAQLHDGVIQDLAGLGYALPTATRELRTGGDLVAARSLLERATGLIQHDTAMLRTLMTDIYPPDLEGGGLREAVQQLVQAEALEGHLEAQLAIGPDLKLSHEAGRLAYRIIREGLRNVVKHADAGRVSVELVMDHPDHVVVRIVDDGRGRRRKPRSQPRRSPRPATAARHHPRVRRRPRTRPGQPERVLDGGAFPRMARRGLTPSA